MTANNNSNHCQKAAATNQAMCCYVLCEIGLFHAFCASYLEKSVISGDGYDNSSVI